MTYITKSDIIADGCRGLLGQLQLACSIPAVREALTAKVDDAEDLMTAVFEYQEEDKEQDLADELEGLEVPEVGTLEWIDGDLFAITYADEDGWVCSDCIMMIANGEAPDDMTEEEAHDLAQACAGYCIASAEDSGQIENSFSWNRCDCCGSTLGGARHAVHYVG